MHICIWIAFYFVCTLGAILLSRTLRSDFDQKLSSAIIGGGKKDADSRCSQGYLAVCLVFSQWRMSLLVIVSLLPRNDGPRDGSREVQETKCLKTLN